VFTKGLKPEGPNIEIKRRRVALAFWAGDTDPFFSKCLFDHEKAPKMHAAGKISLGYTDCTHLNLNKSWGHGEAIA